MIIYPFPKVGYVSSLEGIYVKFLGGNFLGQGFPTRPKSQWTWPKFKEWTWQSATFIQGPTIQQWMIYMYMYIYIHIYIYTYIYIYMNRHPRPSQELSLINPLQSGRKIWRRCFLNDSFAKFGGWKTEFVKEGLVIGKWSHSWLEID